MESSSERLMAEYRHQKFLERQAERDKYLERLNKTLKSINAAIAGRKKVKEKIKDIIMGELEIPLTETPEFDEAGREKTRLSLANKPAKEVRKLIEETIQRLENMSRYTSW